MASVSWMEQPWIAFDTETTGVDVERDHILTASMVHIRPKQARLAETVWINPGVPIPPGATAIHGITDEVIQRSGEDPAESLEAICMVLAAILRDRTALVGMNLPFDLTILDRNCRRVGVAPLAQRLGGAIAPAVDVFVLDKAVDPYRKGSRKLEALCNLYRVPIVQAHSSEHDAYAAAAVAWRIGRMYPSLAALTADQLHQLQAGWKASQDASFARWLRSQNKDAAGVDGAWPWRPPAPEPEEALF